MIVSHQTKKMGFFVKEMKIIQKLNKMIGFATIKRAALKLERF